MHPARRLVSFAACALVVTGALHASPASAAAALPGVAIDSSDVVTVEVKPTEIWPYSDLHYSNMNWTKLTPTAGSATGIRYINTCTPSCADANYLTDEVRMEFSQVQKTRMNQSVFTRVEVTVIKSGQVNRLPLPVGAPTGVVIDYEGTPDVEVKPREIWPYRDIHYSKMTWTRLTLTAGSATGIRYVNTCKPSCADGKYRTDKVRMEFTRVRTTATGQYVFTRVKVTVIKSGKSSSHPLPSGT